MTAEARAAAYAWLSQDDGGLSEGACVTLVAGQLPDEVAGAFGVDLDTTVDPADVQVLAAMVRSIGHTERSGPSAPVALVVENGGYEGTREDVLASVSREGKAASIFWNVEGSVRFACARGGRLLASVELGLGDDLESLPKRLVRLAELADDDDDADPVAIGAAMVSAFVGHDFGPEVLLDPTWHRLVPHVRPIEPITAESSPLNVDERELLDSLLAVPATSRRRLCRALVQLMVDRAGLADHPAVRETLATVDDEGSGTYTPALETAQRRWEAEANRYWLEQSISDDAPPMTREESRRITAGRWVAKGLQNCCSDDDLTALLGGSHAALVIFAQDDLAADLRELVAAAAGSPWSEWPSLLAALPPPPTPEERERAHERQLRQLERDRSTWHREEVWDPEGRLPPGSYEMVDATGRRLLVHPAEDDVAARWERLVDEADLEAEE